MSMLELKKVLVVSATAVLACVQGCISREAANKHVGNATITWRDYLSMFQADPLVRPERQIGRKFLWFLHSKDKTTWDKGPIWVLANIEIIPLGNKMIQRLDVDHVYAERLMPGKFPSCSKIFPVLLTVVNEDDSWLDSVDRLDVGFFGFFSIRCAARMLPVKTYDEKGECYYGCRVLEAYTLESPENHITEWLSNAATPGWVKKTRVDDER